MANGTDGAVFDKNERDSTLEWLRQVRRRWRGDGADALAGRASRKTREEATEWAMLLTCSETDWKGLLKWCSVCTDQEDVGRCFHAWMHAAPDNVRALLDVWILILELQTLKRRKVSGSGWTNLR